jgi:hypothetical protein
MQAYHEVRDEDEFDHEIQGVGLPQMWGYILRADSRAGAPTEEPAWQGEPHGETVTRGRQA